MLLLDLSDNKLPTKFWTSELLNILSECSGTLNLNSCGLTSDQILKIKFKATKIDLSGNLLCDRASPAIAKLFA